MHNSSLIGNTIAVYSGGDKPEYTQAQIRVLHNISIANTLWSFFTHKFVIFVHIQGVSRLEDITAGGDFLGLCDQKKFI